MKLIKIIKKPISLFICLGMMTCQLSAGEDSLRDACESKKAIPLSDQFKAVFPIIDHALAENHPLVLAFGMNRSEVSHLACLPENSFVVCIQNCIWGPENTADFEFRSRDVDLTTYTNAINDPCSIFGDILDPDFYTTLSAKYSGKFNLIATDAGVVEKFKFPREAMVRYVSLLKSGGVMAVDYSARDTLPFQGTMYEIYKENLLGKYMDEFKKIAHLCFDGIDANNPMKDSVFYHFCSDLSQPFEVISEPEFQFLNSESDEYELVMSLEAQEIISLAKLIEDPLKKIFLEAHSETPRVKTRGISRYKLRLPYVLHNVSYSPKT